MYGGGYPAGGYNGGYGGGMNPGMNPGMGGMGMGMNPGMGMGMQPGMGMAPGMYPNVAQGMGLAMGNPFAYRSMNWAGYNMGVYNIPAQWVETQSPMIFMTFDRNQTGSLEMFEVPSVMNYVFTQLGLGQPNMQDVYFCMYNFDANHDGRLNLFEFKRMLHFLAGRRM